MCNQGHVILAFTAWDSQKKKKKKVLLHAYSHLDELI